MGILEYLGGGDCEVGENDKVKSIFVFSIWYLVFGILEKDIAYKIRDTVYQIQEVL